MNKAINLITRRNALLNIAAVIPSVAMSNSVFGQKPQEPELNPK